MRLADPQHRAAIVSTLSWSGLAVQAVDGEADVFLVDFASFDLSVAAQMQIVRRMLRAWEQERGFNILDDATFETVD